MIRHILSGLVFLPCKDFTNDLFIGNQPKRMHTIGYGQIEFLNKKNIYNPMALTLGKHKNQ